MLKKLLTLGLVLLATSSFAQIGFSPGKVESPFLARDLTAPLSTSTGYALAVGTNGSNAITWQTTFSASVTTITITLEGSVDCNTYNTVDTSTSNSGEIRTVFGSYKCIRFNNSAVTGGAGKTLTLNAVYSTGKAVGVNGSQLIPGFTVTGPILGANGPVDIRGTDANSIWIGNNFSSGGFTHTGSIVIGTGISFTTAAHTDSIVIGRGSTVGGSATGSIVLGQGSSTNGNARNIVIGNSVSASGNSSYAFGNTISSASSGQFVLGDSLISTGLTDIVLGGRGDTSTTAGAGAVVWRVTNIVTTANTAGKSIKIVPGNGTGTGGSGDLILQTAPAGSSGSTANTIYDRAYYTAKAKALTESSATSFVQVGIASNDSAGGTVDYCIHATDGTDVQARCGTIDFGGVNKAGTMTCATPNIYGTETNPVSTGTLTNTFTATTGTNACLLQANAVSSLTQTILEIRYSITCHGTCTITPQ